MAAKKKSTMSPPFRDSDAMQIIIKRLELIADKMRHEDYDEMFTRQMAEVSEWLEWLAVSITARDKKEA